MLDRCAVTVPLRVVMWRALPAAFVADVYRAA